MEASNDGRRCAGGGGGNWLDLDKIYEHTPFPLISQAPFPPAVVSDSPHRVRAYAGVFEKRGGKKERE